MFTAFYILFGVCLGGTYIGLISSHIQEHSERLADLRDKEIGKALSKIHDVSMLTRMKKMLKNGISSKIFRNDKGINNSTKSAEAVNKKPISSKKTNDDSSDSDDSDDSDDNDEEDPNKVDDDDEVDVTDKKKIRRILKKQTSLAEIVNLDPYGLTKEEEHNMFDVSQQAFRKDLRRLVIRFLFDALMICFAVFVGMGAMIGFEGWTPIEAFYWAVVTIATIGYGDYYPTSNQSRSFVIVYALVGTTLLVKSLTNIVKIPSLLRMRRKEMNIIKKFGGETHELNSEVFNEVRHAELYKTYPTIKRNKHELSKAEFAILILSMMHKIKDKDLIFACKLFDKIDKNGDNVLDQKDIDEEVVRLAKLDLRITHVITHDDDDNNFDYNLNDIVDDINNDDSLNP